MAGVSGSGKSTQRRDLAARLAGAVYVELDAIFHQANWTPLSEEQFRRRVTAIASGAGWVSSLSLPASHVVPTMPAAHSRASYAQLAELSASSDNAAR
jgi:hypothetical protein